jgi:hypothetical protein
VRVYVPASVDDLRRLEDEGRLIDDGRLVALAVTPWALTELDVDSAEDEVVEFAVLSAAAEVVVDGASPEAVLVFDLPVGDLPADGLEVGLDRDLPRRRLVAVHLPPGLDWYAGHELPQVIETLG